MSGVLLLVIRLIAAIVLYTFVGWAFFLLWKELRQQTSIFENRQIPPLSLVVNSGDSNNPALFHQTEIVIGRDPNCDFTIQDELVSARHARIAYHHAQWWIEDLSSRNGTKLNQDPILTPTVIISGDLLQCGKTAVQIRIG